MMFALWAHTDEVSCSHPMTGGWAHGWDEVSATWTIAAGMGKLAVPPGATRRPVSTIEDVRVRLAPDFALVTSMYALTMGVPDASPVRLNMTNAFRKVEGAWKLILHHADKAPALDSTLLP
jgi:ketosteroid isomerase-like protein